MNKILITRTDRIGDVLLSSPVFRAARESFPTAHIAVIVRPYAKEAVEGNPYIDEVIIYDKYGSHKSILGSLKFCVGLAKRKFDMALILHPTNRMHIITMLAGIPQRVGFDRKCSIFLTKRIPHRKQLGEKHERDYTLDVAQAAGIEVGDKSLFFPVKRDFVERIEKRLAALGVSSMDRLITIHPAASCPSKRWGPDKFAKLADELVIRFASRIAVISGVDDTRPASQMIGSMRHEAFDFSGKTTVGELGALIKRSELLISNDSGPVHIGTAVGTPVIAIFGRKDKGLGPTRWRPLGQRDVVIHKNVGCEQCLAHNCKIGFKCLEAVTVDEVLEAAARLLRDNNGRREL